MAERPMVGARVDLETKQQLESIAQRLGSTTSRLVAELIAVYLDQERVNPTGNAFELLQVTLESLQTPLAAAATQEQVALLSQQLDRLQSSSQEVLAALATPPQPIQPVLVPPQVDFKLVASQRQRIKDLSVAIPFAVTAVLNRVSHSLIKLGVGCRVLGVVNANENGCQSGHQSRITTPDPPFQGHSVEVSKTKAERVKSRVQTEFRYDLKQLAVRFSLKEAEWTEWEVALPQAEFINKLEQRTGVAWCAVDKLLPGQYYQDSGFFN